MNRRDFLRNTVAAIGGIALKMEAVAAAADVAETATAGLRPNVIIILADDLGYGDCGVNNPGSKIATPNIDQLAAEGLRFTDAHSASITCSPSRYGLLTGINPARTGVRNTLLRTGRPLINEKEKTLASMLKDRGYVTKMVGKWHIGAVKKGSPLSPNNMGFDESFSHDNFFEMDLELSRNGNLPEFLKGDGSEVTVDEVPVINLYKYEEERYGRSVVRFLNFKNDEEHNLGDTPIPGGMLKVYRTADPTGH